MCRGGHYNGCHAGRLGLSASGCVAVYRFADRRGIVEQRCCLGLRAMKRQIRLKSNFPEKSIAELIGRSRSRCAECRHGEGHDGQFLFWPGHRFYGHDGVRIWRRFRRHVQSRCVGITVMHVAGKAANLSIPGRQFRRRRRRSGSSIPRTNGSVVLKWRPRLSPISFVPGLTAPCFP